MHAGSVIAMQVSSSNVWSAGKWYLLKLKKLKMMPVSVDLFATLKTSTTAARRATEWNTRR